MLCLSDFVTCRKRYYNQRRGLYLSFGKYLLLTLISKNFLWFLVQVFIFGAMGSISKVKNIM